MPGHVSIAEAILKQHEGLRLKPYLCTAGKQTIGYGRNMDDKGLTKDEALHLLANDIYECEKDIATFPYWGSLSDNQKAAMIDMRFCLGATGFRSFRKMNAALKEGDYVEAAHQILDSRFAKQVKGRAQDLADMIVMGDY